ncbi:MAG: hypothetical protein O7F08_03855, partial [Deltaproteobacteria bacterium]|nr:hypothetical protein [Deltaproteobacteria bacterium]
EKRKPVKLRVADIARLLTERLKAQLKLELQYDRDQLIDRKHWLRLEQVFVEKRIYKLIEDKTTAEAVRKAVWTGMKKHQKLFVRPMVEEDVTRLLELRIRRISVYDIERNRKDIEEIDKKIKGLERQLKTMVKSTVSYLERMLEKFGDQFPRRTTITEIEAVDKKAVARQNLRLSYDKKTSFFGTEVRGDQFRMTVSEFEFVLAIAKDGTYRIMSNPEKVLFTGPLIYAEIFDPEKGIEFTVAYRDNKKIAYVKKIRIEKFIRNREYRLIKDKGGRIDELLAEGVTGSVHMNFVPQKRQRIKEADFDLSTLELTSPSARGARMAPKPVGKVKFTAVDLGPTKPPKPKGGAAGRALAQKPAASKGEQGDLF